MATYLFRMADGSMAEYRTVAGRMVDVTRPHVYHGMEDGTEIPCDCEPGMSIDDRLSLIESKLELVSSASGNIANNVGQLVRDMQEVKEWMK